MARSGKTDGRKIARPKRRVESPGDLLGGGQIQLGIEDDELPADQGAVGIRAGVSAQAAGLAADTRAEDCAAREDRNSRSGEGGRGQGEDPGAGEPVCSACEKRAGRYGGEYHMTCMSCCVDLVMSTRPNRIAAAAMLAVVEKWQDRATVIAEIKRRMK
jgi:hypothetical protein